MDTSKRGGPSIAWALRVLRSRRPLSVISCIDFSQGAAGGEMIPGYEDAGLSDLKAFTTDKERQSTDLPCYSRSWVHRAYEEEIGDRTKTSRS
jgi:hypothetical protein